MLHRSLWATVVFVLLLPNFSPAQANDTEAELGIGGLVLRRSANIEMRSEDLYLSMDEVRVRYRFYNKSANDVRTIVAFPMPDIPSPSSEGDDDGDLEFRYVRDAEEELKFSTNVDGVRVKTQVERKAIANGVDRTNVLKRLGISLDPWVAKELLHKLPKPAQDELLQHGLVHYLSNDGESDSPETWISPNWTLKISYFWQQVFPARTQLVIDHRYRPVVGNTVALSSVEALRASPREYRSTYCIDDELLGSLEHGQTYINRWLSYILTTGANWSGPIGAYRLVVDKGTPDNFVSFCGSGVKKIGPTQFEKEANNFVPKKDLEILFLIPAGSSQEPDATLLEPDALASNSCADLWHQRNSIFKPAGYCFKTARAIKAFGNAGCLYDRQDDLPLSEIDRQNIRLIQRVEKSKRCRR